MPVAQPLADPPGRGSVGLAGEEDEAAIRREQRLHRTLPEGVRHLHKLRQQAMFDTRGIKRAAKLLQESRRGRRAGPQGGDQGGQLVAAGTAVLPFQIDLGQRLPLLAELLCESRRVETVAGLGHGHPPLAFFEQRGGPGHGIAR